MRLQKRDIPNTPHLCPKIKCVYNGLDAPEGICNEPEINNGNSDAICFSITNRKVIEMLTKMEGDAGNE
jgi:hypothetical protein